MRHTSILAAALLVSGAAIVSADAVDEQRHRDALEHFRKGQESMYSEKWEEAEREFRISVRLDPLLHIGYYSLGQTYMAMKRYPDAIKAHTSANETFDKVAGLSQSNAAEYDRRVDDEIREMRDAVRFLREQVSTPNANSKVINAETKAIAIEARIETLEGQKRRETGRITLPAEYSLALGSAYLRNGNLEDAQREYLAAIDTRPGLGEAHNNLAVVYMQTGRFKEALESVDAAEKNGFKVNPRLREDIKTRMKAAGGA